LNKILKELRYMTQTQVLYKYYSNPEFKYMQSLGIKDLMQSFIHHEHGFIGFLHLKWKKLDNKNTWSATWYNTPEEAISVATELQSNKIYDENKILHKVYNINIEQVEQNQIIN
tara:strand:+ start:2111 stop:2452 length:342 start_codon:yes stop_codon:yes gene_type:complete